jgi:hypothetical protein
MRKPTPDDKPADNAPPPPGGRARGRADQFARSRGLPVPPETPADTTDAPSPATPPAPPAPGKR